MRPEAFLFVEPHAGYSAREASSRTAAPSLSRLELAWERLLRRRYLLGVVSSSYGTVSAADAHASKKSLCRFLRPGSRADSTGRDGNDVRAQSEYDDVVSDFNGFLGSRLQHFLVPGSGDAWVLRSWSSGLARWSRVDLSEYEYGTGSGDGYSRSWTEKYDDPQFSMPPVPFMTLAEAWLRAPHQVTAADVRTGIGPDGDVALSRRTYTVPRWSTSLPEADVDGVSTVDVEGTRTIVGSVGGYGVSVDFSLLYETYDLRRSEPGRLHHAFLASIPARAPTWKDCSGHPRGTSRVYPVPSVAVNRCVDEGWVSDDLARLPPRLAADAAACFVPPALVPCLRAEWPPPDGWCAGMPSSAGGVPYGDAASVKSPLRVLYRATFDGMDEWLARLARTATAFTGILCPFDASARVRWDWTRRTVYSSDSTSYGGGTHHYGYETDEDDWSEASAYASGTYVFGGGNTSFTLSRHGTYISPGGYGVRLPAPSASGSAERTYRSREDSYWSDSVTEGSRTTLETIDEEGRAEWSVSLDLRYGVPVWSAPWSYSWTRDWDGKSQSPQSHSGTESSSGELRRVIPPEYMPFVRRAEVFALVEVEARADDAGTGLSEEWSRETHSVDPGSYSQSTSGSTEDGGGGSVEMRLVSLGVLDESGALPSRSLSWFLGQVPPADASAPNDGDAYGEPVRERRTSDVTTGRYPDTTNAYDDVERVRDRLARAGSRSFSPQYLSSSGGAFILVVDWDFDAEHDPFADSELNALWGELAEAGRARAAAIASRDAAGAALLKAEAALAAAEAVLAALEAELESLDDGGESARRLAELGEAVSDAEGAVARAVAAREAAEAAEAAARAALDAELSAEEPDEEELERLAEALRDARGALMDAERDEEAARRGLESAEAALKRYRDLVDAAEGAREALEAEISEAEGEVSSAEAAVAPAEAAKSAADAAYAAADAAYQAILARIRSAST